MCEDVCEQLISQRPHRAHDCQQTHPIWCCCQLILYLSSSEVAEHCCQPAEMDFEEPMPRTASKTLPMDIQRM
jgi:hypothetical protein